MKLVSFVLAGVSISVVVAAPALGDEYADSVVSFVSGIGAAGTGSEALGAPDVNVTILGHGGVLTLDFDDNICLDDGTGAADFTVYEEFIPEGYSVAIGLQGGTLTTLAMGGGSTTSFDTGGIPFFNRIAILDDGIEEHPGGVDIDAVECLNSGAAVAASMDIKFCSDPNAFNSRRSTGVVPVTIFGAATFDASDIDLLTVMLCELNDPTNCTGAPKSWSIADRGDPTSDLGASQCAMDVGNPDGFDDLDVGFSAAEVCAVIDCPSLGKGDTSPMLVVVGATTGGDFFITNVDVLHIVR